MQQTLIAGFPKLDDTRCLPTLLIRGTSAFVRYSTFIGRYSLESGQVEWVVERAIPTITDAASSRPRQIHSWGSELWYGELDDVIAELIPTEDGALTVCGRNGRTGRRLWEHVIPIPEAADWAEPTPAWPGAPTEEIEAFIADDASRLIVCLFRQSRRSGLSDPGLGIEVFTLPPYACQTDAVRFVPRTGQTIWSGNFRNLQVGLLERQCFTGIWSNGSQLGMLEFETGKNSILHESPHQLGWPVRDGSTLSVPWHSKKDVGVAWVDLSGRHVRRAVWPHTSVRSTTLHTTELGLALQTNDHALWWMGKESQPLWKIRAKPYIYRVIAGAKSDVFVGTDGRGGRLYAFDAVSGNETLNLRPAFGGVGTLARVPQHDLLIASTSTSSRDFCPGSLLIVSMRNRSHHVARQCGSLLTTWDHGAVCLTGSRCERLSVVDIRSVHES